MAPRVGAETVTRDAEPRRRRLSSAVPSAGKRLSTRDGPAGIMLGDLSDTGVRASRSPGTGRRMGSLGTIGGWWGQGSRVRTPAPRRGPWGALRCGVGWSPHSQCAAEASRRDHLQHAPPAVPRTPQRARRLLPTTDPEAGNVTSEPPGWDRYRRGLGPSVRDRQAEPGASRELLSGTVRRTTGRGCPHGRVVVVLSGSLRCCRICPCRCRAAGAAGLSSPVCRCIRRPAPRYLTMSGRGQVRI